MFRHFVRKKKRHIVRAKRSVGHAASMSDGQLLVFGGTVIGGREKAKQPLRFVSYAGSEEQPVTRSGCIVIAELQCPQPVVLQCMPVGIAQEPIEAPAGDVVNSDLAAADIPYKDVVAIEPEVRWRQSNTPRRIQPRSALQPLQEFAGWRELVDKSEPRKVQIIMLGRVLSRIGNVKIPVDLLDIKWGKTLRNLRLVHDDHRCHEAARD
jgi:hypothetical protein